VNTLSRKLRELEINNVAPLHIEEGSTRLSPYCMSDAERELHSAALQIMQSLKTKAERASEMLKQNPGADVDVSELQLNPEQQVIVNTSDRLFTERVMELFDNGVAQYIHLNDPVNKFIFYSRLNWFLREMGEWLFLRWQEDQIYDAPDFFNLCSGEQEHRLKPIYDRWRKWLSEESWERYYEQHCRSAFRSYEDLTPEEKAEEERNAENEERENAEWVEQDKRFLRDKCPSCIEKCKWYHEQTGNKRGRSAWLKKKFRFQCQSA
jgi:hypothetical protein